MIINVWSACFSDNFAFLLSHIAARLLHLRIQPVRAGKPARALRTGLLRLCSGKIPVSFLFHSKNIFRILEDLVCHIDILCASLGFAL